MNSLDYYYVICFDDIYQFMSRQREFKKLDMNDFISSVYVPKDMSRNPLPKYATKKKSKK